MDGPMIAGAFGLAAAVAYWLRLSWRDTPGLQGAAIKTASTGFVALALWLQTGQGEAALLWPFALGLTLGAAGDWFLARPGERSFLAGMAAFGLGHLAYVSGIYALAAARGWPEITTLHLAAAGVLALLLLSTEVWLAPRTGALLWPVRAYVLLIGLMGAALLALPGGAGAPLILSGGVLFVLSDLLLALRLFVARDPRAQRALSLSLWPAYWLGQALIAGGAALYALWPG